MRLIQSTIFSVAPSLDAALILVWHLSLFYIIPSNCPCLQLSVLSPPCTSWLHVNYTLIMTGVPTKTSFNADNSNNILYQTLAPYIITAHSIFLLIILYENSIFYWMSVYFPNLFVLLPMQLLLGTIWYDMWATNKKRVVCCQSM